MGGPGVVHIVGAGPGDPGLVTLRALELVRRADAIVYDRLAPRSLLAEARPGARLIYAGKAPGRHALTQEEINGLLASLALEGLEVVRLHGGDPLTYGRGEEECLHLASRGIPCDVTPGVPSFTAAAAAAMAPLAARGYSSSFAVTTAIRAGGAPVEEARLEALARAADSLAVLMGARSLPRIAGVLSRLDPRTPLVVVERLGLEGERIIDSTAGEARGIEAEPPAVIIAGGAASFRRRWLCLTAGLYC